MSSISRFLVSRKLLSSVLHDVLSTNKFNLIEEGWVKDISLKEMLV